MSETKGIDAFIYRGEEFGKPFSDIFLASADFNVNTLQDICKESKWQVPKQRLEKIELISSHCQSSDVVKRSVLRHLVGRSKTWVSIADASTYIIPPDKKNLGDALELVTELGKEIWYGPIDRPYDSDVKWYIRPIWVKHKEVRDKKVQEVIIRSLCFVRLTKKRVSFHWNGFTYSKDEAAQQTSRFEMWSYMPKLIQELQELLGVKLDFINLVDLVLYKLWDKYRYDKDFEWKDIRIRAESGGVSLSAHAGSSSSDDEENDSVLDISGVRRLANTIRRSVVSALEKKWGQPLTETEWIDEVILRTLIQQYGPLSYEFSLKQNDGTKIFHAHSYFGAKPDFPSEDSFPHFRVYFKWGSDLDHLGFVMKHLY